MSTVQERLHNFRQYLHREAGERVWSVGGALRFHLNNFSVDVLKDYIALSRHQFELIEFVTQRTGMDTGEPQRIEVMNWPKGRPDVFIDRGRPRTDEVPEWELQMLEDMAWRAQAMGRALSNFEQGMTISTPEDLMELSRHQCEMLNFLKTGSFRKVPRRRKARTISGGAATPQSEERIKILGEALKEYQGRIEIRTVREFIALSKHQCELAGLLFAEAESGLPVFEVVGYEEAYPNAVGRSPLFGKEGPGEISSVAEERQNPPQSPFAKGGSNNAADSGLRPEPYISDRQTVQGTETPAHHQMFSNNEISGADYKSAPANVNGPVVMNMPYQSVPLDPAKVYDLPRVPMLEGNMIPLPADGRWVQVDTPDGPMAMRSIPPPEPEYYMDHASGVAGNWEDDYWDEDWEEP